MRHLIIVAFLSGTIFARSLYIDYESGSDSNSGFSKTQAWQHCPGDNAAKSNAQACVLAAGDSIYFKGGVRYRGSIYLNTVGAMGKPIVFCGNGWGNDRAFIDGSEILKSDWKKSDSASLSKMNPNWKNIWTTLVQSTDSCYQINLQENDSLSFVAQYPSPSDPFFNDNTLDYTIPTSITKTSLKDEKLPALGGSMLVGKYVFIYHTNNVVLDYIITKCDSTGKTISYNTLSGEPFTGDRARYALANYCGFIDKPGKYTFEEKADASNLHRIYYWPRNSNPNNSVITLSKRTSGLVLRNCSNIVLQGFHIQNLYGSRDAGDGNGVQLFQCDSIVIRDNIFEKNRFTHYGGYGSIFAHQSKRCVIENNICRNNPLHRGIFVISGESMIVRNNVVIRPGSTGISFYSSKNGIVTENRILGGHSTHGNGMSFYAGNSSIVIAYNRVINANILLTMEDSKDITVYSNIFDGRNSTLYVIADWGGMSGRNAILNNTILGASQHYSLYVTAADTGTFTLFNNILDGGGTTINKRDNNLYVGLSWDQSVHYGWKPAQSELVGYNGSNYVAHDLKKVLWDSDSGDCRLFKNSLALKNGRNICQYLPLNTFKGFNFFRDIAGMKRDSSMKWNIGAHENVPLDVSIVPALKNGNLHRIRILNASSERILLSGDMDAEDTQYCLYTIKGFQVEITPHRIRNDRVEIKPLNGHIAKGYYILQISEKLNHITIPYILLQ